MKNVSWLFINLFTISAAFSLNNSILTDSSMSARQPKFYGPLLGLLLSSLFGSPITGKIPSYGTIRLSYDPPLHSSVKPDYSHSSYGNQEDHYANFQPSAYGAPQYYPTLTTAIPEIHHHHHIKGPTSQQQIVTIHEHPSDVIIEEVDTVNPLVNTNTEINSLASLEKPSGLDEPISAESNVRFRRQRPPQNYRENRRRTTTIRPKQKRGTQRYSGKRNKYYSSKKKRYSTTTPDYYYDSYEDYTTQRSKKRTQPKRPIYSYEDEDDEEYDYDASYEFTTRRPYKKRRRTTTRRNRYKNKNKKRQEITSLDNYSDEDDYDFDYRQEPFTETINIRPRQETTTMMTTNTPITNGTTTPSPNATTTTANTTTGYGYGPSNGNEGVSITYGPPTGQHPVYGPPRPSYGPPSYPLYHAQYTDWYDNDAARNAIVKRVHDIMGLEHVFPKTFK